MKASLKKMALDTLDDEARAEQAAGLVARFGGRAGQHGPIPGVRVGMMLRLPREANLDLIRISSHVGPRPTTLITELALIAARCQPQNWHAAVLAFQRVAEKDTAA